MHKVRIGVFDSGKGGLSFVRAIEQSIKNIEVIFESDSANVPYGNKTPEELSSLALPKIKRLEQAGAKVIVIACNTVTTTIIDQIRREIKTPIVAIEPMIKPAAELTKSKVIAVCATPTTLDSKRYSELIEDYAQDLTVIEPDCSDWSYMVENSSIDLQSVRNRITYVCEKGADVIVLGCTHYHWITDEIESIANKYKAKVIHSEQAVTKQLRITLRQLG